GNQVGMAAGVATVGHMEEQNILQNVELGSEELMDGLEELKGEYGEIGDVGGRGVMIGIEMVDGGGGKDGLGDYLENGGLGGWIQRECLKNGLIVEVGGGDLAVLGLLR
ncbi:aminotransferase class III-fold pyridoxal phosphate-dependent enzyme, partial [Paenibacillus xylanexedens]|uniref:aminotransferase class III-fold pyridoxal phosphate-dependent enzyme n=1 Tax=Paenibacillus xylanexedens TaxID=528191 RepID=UPI0011A8CC37